VNGLKLLHFGKQVHYQPTCQPVPVDKSPQNVNFVLGLST